MGVVQAVNTAQLALKGGGSHRGSLDGVIKTKLDTGRDTRTDCTETARAGLAVDVVAC